ncbi:MAG: hypothetical protein AB1716_14300 [Planctomycetota bacterium]
MSEFIRSYNFAFTPPQVAAALEVGMKLLREVIEYDRIACVRLGPRRFRILESTIRRYIGLKLHEELPGDLDRIALEAERAVFERARKRRPGRGSRRAASTAAPARAARGPG